MANDLLGGSDSETEDLQINESYAKSYDNFREKEVIQKLKDRYGEKIALESLKESQETDSDSSEYEDPEFSPTFEKDFLKTLSCLKGKDPKIYDGKTSFFSNESTNDKTTKKLKSPNPPKIFLSDLERQVMMEKGGEFDEISQPELKKNPGYFEELEEIKQRIKNVKGENDEDEEDFLVIKQKNKEEKEKDNENFPEEFLPSDWKEKDLPYNEKFLRDYIVHKKYLQSSSSVSPKQDSLLLSSENLSEDEKTLEEMEDFENKFNFRYEEPDGEFIKRYPRTIANSLRKKDESRKRKRENVKKRKEEKRKKEVEELKILKAFKKKELSDKMRKICSVAGNDGRMSLEEKDLESDFDPVNYDRRMKEIFDTFEVNYGEEETKPVIPSDLDDSEIEEMLEIENWDSWERGKAEDEKDEEEDKTEFSKNGVIRQRVETESPCGKKRKRRQSYFASVIESHKPVFDYSTNPNFQSYLDEYYKLDYEDKIGDLTCRFKYRNVEKNNFGLNVNEILSAPDSELNSWCSLKKTIQFKSEEEEKNEISLYKSKGENISLKKKLLPSLFKGNEVEEVEKSLKAEKVKKSLKNKKKNKKGSKELNHSKEQNDEEELKKTLNLSQNDVIEKKTSKETNNRKKRKRNSMSKKKKVNPNAEIAMSDTRLAAYGLAPGKIKRKIKNKVFRDLEKI